MTQTNEPKTKKSQAKPESSVNAPKIQRVVMQPRKKRWGGNNLWYIIGGLIAVSIIWSLFSPGLNAREIELNNLIHNLKNNQYAKLDIRDDGKVVATKKYIALAKGNIQEIKSSDKKLVVKQITDNKQIKEISLNDLAAKLKPLSLKELVQRLKNRDTTNIQTVFISEDFILADDANKKNPDYLIKGASEADFQKLLTESGIAIDTLTTNIVYLRTAAETSKTGDIENQIKNKEAQEVFVLGDYTFSVLKNEKIEREFVWHISQNDFTEILQREKITLEDPTTDINTVVIPRIPWGDLFTIAILIGFGTLAFLMFRGVQGSGNSLMKFGQSKARLIFGRKPDVTFKDVAGVDEAKDELEEIVLFLKDPKRFLNLGARIPKGVLMVGAPGTGKTLLARAIAGEAGVPFFHTSGSEFEEMLVGAGASRVRDLFEKAKKAAPSIIFIDEIDAVARKRGTTIQSGTTEQTLNQILVEMDGFEKNVNVIVIAATNRPDVLDKAILRPGRFDRRIVLDLPDIEGRKQIIKIHAKNKPLAKSINLETISKRTVGFSGADIENMLNEAAIITAIANRKEITFEDIEEAANKVQIGPARRRKRTEKELKMTAYHEAGHAIVMKKTPEHDPVHRVTIVSRGMALGYTMPLPETDELQISKTKMLSQITALVAGFVTEDMIFGDVTSGASNDIEKASNLARRMVKSFGMSKRMGLIKYGEDQSSQYLGYNYEESKNYSESTAREIDEEVKRIIDECYAKAKKILEEHKPILDKIVAALLDKEVLDDKDFDAFFK
ncbi:MAG: ATP-dependent zinc metalloprotease FtsH [bacterium]